MNCRGADPFVFFDKKSQLYYIYATDDSKDNEGKSFIIYKSKDLTHLEYVGYALDIEYNRWGLNWFWAPIVLFNPNNDLYYLFYSSRAKNELLLKYFDNPNYEEGCKIGVATSTSPEGPFRNISDEPIDYRPYDKNYLNIEEISDNPNHPTISYQEAKKIAKEGTYVPLIDIDIYFEDGRAYFYFSRCCYKNFVYDEDLNKFIEESNIVACEFDIDFWLDKSGKKMPRLLEKYHHGDKDEYIDLISYHKEKQSWENAHTDDFNKYNGHKKDRRWSEGSTIFKKNINGKDVYFMTYSCNNYENEAYGVGIAYSSSPLGPFKKYEKNPIIHQIEEENIFSTGHGSYLNIDGRDYYIFHMRDSRTADRCVAWCELFIKSTNDIRISKIHKCELINH